MNEKETKLRKELGIPENFTGKVVILGEASHMDWDWLKTFDQYYEKDWDLDFRVYAVKEILKDAANYLNRDKDKPQSRYYQVAEVAWLQKFAEDEPGEFERLCEAGGLLRIVGGGITSPDTLLPHGEAILRNFLEGNTWIMNNFPRETGENDIPPVPPLRQAWVPDDFGLDSQFPVLMEAMGLEAVGFSRIPGDPQQYWTFNDIVPYSGGEEMAAWQLAKGKNRGTDFIWTASDGSSTLAHWMQAGYFQGQDIIDGNSKSQESIKKSVETNADSAPTPYIYVPVSVDFRLPQPNYLEAAAQWNKKPLIPDVYVVVATFDHYAQLVDCHREKLKKRAYNPAPGKNILSFQSTPYWTGFYASRPELKKLHQETVRALLGAEVFGVITKLKIDPSYPLQREIVEGWKKVLPSTHHDYITGTGTDEVYNSEQLPLLEDALSMGEKAYNSVIDQITPCINTIYGNDRLAVVIYNQLGFARGGPVEIDPVPGFTPVTFGSNSQTLGLVQVTPEGKWLFSIPRSGNDMVPGTGWNTYYLSSDKNQKVRTSQESSFICKESEDGKTIILQNDYLSATLKEEEGWGLAAFGPNANESILGQTANNIIYCPDQGDDYKFGNEIGFPLEKKKADFQASGVKILEDGPVLKRVRIEGTYIFDDRKCDVTREYCLLVNEPFLRMITNGAVPNPYSAYVEFPFTTKVEEIEHGTPYHWDRKPAQPIYNTYNNNWTPPIFEATHRFIIPGAAGKPAAAIYHSYLQGWTVDGEVALMGCLLRNPNTQEHGQCIPSVPADPDSHTLEYALRTAEGIEEPESGSQLRESLSYQTPLPGRALKDSHPGGSSQLPPRFCLAETSSDRAIITTVKTGTMNPASYVLRIYHPSNTPLKVTILLFQFLPENERTSGLRIRKITALETDIEGEKYLPVEDGSVTFTAERALTTLLIETNTGLSG